MENLDNNAPNAVTHDILEVLTEAGCPLLPKDIKKKLKSKGKKIESSTLRQYIRRLLISGKIQKNNNKGFFIS